jgi:6-phosphogluconolactonase
LADNPEVSLKNIKFYFGDEGCVSPTHKDSNYVMVMESLFVKGVPTSSTIYCIKTEDNYLESLVETYSELLPSKIDVLLLGMGDDGHVASFPEGDVYEKKCTTVIPVICNKLPYKRVSVKPKLFNDSKAVFLLAKGKKKGKVLAKAMAEPDNYIKLPACLALEATWLLDADVFSQISVID